MTTDKSGPLPQEPNTESPAATETRAAEQLEAALRQWHQHSKQQHRLDNAQRLALQQLVVTPEVRRVGLGDLSDERLTKAIGQVQQAFDLPRAPAVSEVFDRRFLPPLADRLP